MAFTQAVKGYMLQVIDTLYEALVMSWPWAASFAASLFGFTMAAGALLNKQSKQHISRWLAGEVSEENWARSFNTVFDAIFGERHFSLQCFARSSIASIIATILIYALLDNTGTLSTRTETFISFSSAIVAALTINAVCDYLSLLQTRYFLQIISKRQRLIVHVLIVAGDILASGLIISLGIFIYSQTPLYFGGELRLMSVVGLFSILSIPFYTTFLTTAWSITYAVSVGVIRFLIKLRIGRLLDVSGKPILVLSTVVGTITGALAAAISVLFVSSDDGMAFGERLLCELSGVKQCFEVGSTSQDPRITFNYLLEVCSDHAIGEAYNESTFDEATFEICMATVDSMDLDRLKPIVQEFCTEAFANLDQGKPTGMYTYDEGNKDILYNELGFGGIGCSRIDGVISGQIELG